jgi:hypothetical protein
MTRQKLYSLFEQLAHDQRAATDTDLWPAIKSTLIQDRNRIKGEKRVKTQLNWRPARTLAGVSVILALLVGFFAFTPQGKALAQVILHFFVPQEDNALVVSDPEPAPLEEAAPVSAPPAVPEAVSCLDSPFPQCSLDEAQQHVGFPIAFPAEMPSDFTFEGVKVLDNGVLLAFSAPKGGYYLYETPFTDEGIIANPVGEAAEIKALSVNGQYAEYVEGTWYGTPNESGAILWDNNDSVRTLIWAVDGIEYKLVSSGGKVYDSARPSPEEMAAFAETLIPEAKPDIAVDNGLSLAEAEQQAGFTMTLPTQIPPRILMTNATYNPAQGVICQHYSDSQGINNDTLVVAASLGGLLDPNSFSMGGYPGPDGEMITPTMFVEHVDMPGALNDKAIYLSNGIQITTLCGEERNTNHGVMWHKDGMSYYAFGYMDGSLGYPFVTYNELLKIASEISGVAFAGLDSPDPQRLTSLGDAQSVWGDKIAFPRKMLAGVNFDHFTYGEFDDGDQMLEAIFTKNPVTEFVALYQISESQPLGLDVYGDGPNQTVWGLPAIYQNVCWDGAYAGCHVNLIWVDGNMRYELSVRTLKLVPVEQVLEIAESAKP